MKNNIFLREEYIWLKRTSQVPGKAKEEKKLRKMK